MFATKVVIGVNKRLISPSVIEQSAHGVQKRIWREEYKMKREKTTAIKKAIKDKIERLRLIRDELNTLLEIL